MLRKIIVRVALWAFFFAFLVWQGWSAFKLNTGLKTVLLNKLKTSLGEGCSIETLRVGLGTVQLS
ncbi:MAG TPA: hypothetical protein VGA99_11700, partial [bacterium]